MSVTYIYALIDPRDGRIRYVGKADNPRRRLANHMTPAQLRPKSYKNSWLKALRVNGYVPGIMALQCVPKSSWQEAERYWIATLRRSCALTNGTSGGDGVCEPSPEVLARISRKGRPAWNKGKVMSAEWKRLHPNARAQKGKEGYWTGSKLTDEHKAKLSAAKKGKPSWNKGVPMQSKSREMLARTWELVDPGGNEYLISNLKQFCKERGLQDALMHHVATGKRKHHKGWICRRIETR